uniref:NADPH-dependent FMN reductase-like domain-containing protein n=1 Tax=Corethron hystrix TaxID=216773 RepID=A0A7S1FQU1_9STRA
MKTGIWNSEYCTNINTSNSKLEELQDFRMFQRLTVSGSGKIFMKRRVHHVNSSAIVTALHFVSRTSCTAFGNSLIPNPKITFGNNRFSYTAPSPKNSDPKGVNRINCLTKMFGSNSNIGSTCWDGSDKNAFASLSHPGYSDTSDEKNHVGGWLAHRLNVDTANCWVKDVSKEDLTKFDYYSNGGLQRKPRILVIYGSLRESSFSRKLAFEFARLLEELGCDVRTYNPVGLPVRDPTLENEIKVKELRALSLWSDGHVWVSPEMHGQITGVFKNQIDWLPLNTGSVRPTQGRTCCVAQVNGGSQSFNAVNTLRTLARWMRMPCCTNQSSVPKAWQEFDDAGRMKDSPLRDRVVDVAEEFAKFTAVMAPVAEELTNRYSERKEKAKEGRLLTQAEKEVQKTTKESKQS